MTTFEFDATIVLANLMDSQGALNVETCARLEAGVSTINLGASPLLVTCGWNYRADSEICIADAMKAHAMNKLSLRDEVILTEKASRDTVGDAIFTKRNFAAPRNWRRILVVTSAYHIDRTQKIFEFVYGPNYRVGILAAPSQMSDELKKSEEMSLKAFNDTFEGINAGDDAKIFE